ncbi:MAG: hypothetical protein WBA51_06735 [Erythrobacter sp.]
MPQDDLDAIGSDVTDTPEDNSTALAEDKKLELEAIKENNRASEAKADKELGYFGRFFGSRENVIFYIVFIITLFSMFVTIGAFALANTAAVEVFKTAMFMGFGFLVGQKVSS